MKIFGNRLRELRQHKKITQKELGKRFKLSESAIGMYERGEREPSLELARQFADFFGVSLDYLTGQTDDPKGHVIDQTILNDPDILKLFNIDRAEVDAAMNDPEKLEKLLSLIGTVIKTKDEEFLTKLMTVLEIFVDTQIQKEKTNDN
ncbi:helix-turn-helix domain-containing protein [Lihuaxuella thermophila]|uniref:DNA-binding transcriptional regulator, XRE-family HTH domain n=1 Tax=Lihuaxuella thermophila TaxID=1173111 RepID=A0A1H8HBT4_9BACL|nr:helix-turn-helix domain-containing protein [Lihuaxuella thermophila]SEN53038.1 DNA-binding transcriptional regulator, XRE-family HTH domain [Lihuaxuella thermophila]